MNDVRQFMHDKVMEHVDWHCKGLPVEVQVSLGRAGTPAMAELLNADLAGLQPHR